MHKEWNALMAFMISSAIGCVDEPPIYGPLRLIEAMEKLIAFAVSQGLSQDARLLEIAKKIETGKTLCMYDREAFVALLGEIGLQVTDLLAE